MHAGYQNCCTRAVQGDHADSVVAITREARRVSATPCLLANVAFVAS